MLLRTLKRCESEGGGLEYVDLADLLRFHQSSETHPVVIAQFAKLIELVECVKKDPFPGELTGYYLNDDLHLRCVSIEQSVSIEVSVTWKAYGPVENGLPVFHYLLRVRDDGPKGWLTIREPRRQTAEEAARVIKTEFELY